ncbi:MAG: LysM peptidoglycan-binding domain-containing protein [Clostridia bacterium]|nr:LysM peptidoglycan-binding domain-containing protein [Clostridia bacterium]MDD4387261.1 LysM peptidoglycan-binding domain-containing protein [Clostridia bacterium]
MEYVYSNGSNTMNGSKRGSKLRKNKVKQIFQNILMLVFIFIIISMFFNVSLGKDKLTTKTIIVDSGTTLWNIANKICINNEDLNVQNVIIQIKKINNLQSSMIYEGQELLIYNY